VRRQAICRTARSAASDKRAFRVEGRAIARRTSIIRAAKWLGHPENAGVPAILVNKEMT
jgi:hypothetical protein